MASSSGDGELGRLGASGRTPRAVACASAASPGLALALGGLGGFAIWSLIEASNCCRCASWPWIDERCAARSATTSGLCRARALQLDLALFTAVRNVLHLAEHTRVLPRDAIHRFEPVQQVVERAGAEHDLECASLAPVHVERDEPGREVRLRVLQARARDHEMARVRHSGPTWIWSSSTFAWLSASIACSSLAVDRLDLGEDVLRLGPLRVDVRIGGSGIDGGRRNGQEEGRQQREDRRCLARALSGSRCLPLDTHGNPVGARTVTSGAP